MDNFLNKIPINIIYYAPVVDRHFYVEYQSANGIINIVWCSTKQNLNYGGTGPNGWQLATEGNQLAASKKGFKYGWGDDSSHRRDSDLRVSLKGYRLTKELPIPKSFLTQCIIYE